MSTLLDSGFAGVEGLADAVATKIGLCQSSSGSYVLTKLAILGASELVGIGGSLAKLDTTGFTLAQIKKGIEEIQKSLNIVLGAPLQLALEAYWNGINQFQNNQLNRCVEEVREMQRHARQAYVYSVGKPSLKNLSDAAVATNLCMMAEVMLTSFDGDKIVPFYMLEKDKKRVIVAAMERDIKKLQDYKDKINKGSWLPTSKKKNNKQQDALDQVLKVAYPFLSEGQGATSSLAVVKEAVITIRVLVKYLPDGAEDKTKVMVGREGGKPRAVYLWKKYGEVFLERWQGMKKKVPIPSGRETDELQVTIPWLSAAEGVVISGNNSSNLCGQYWRVHTEEGSDAAPVYQLADTTNGAKRYLYRAGGRGWQGEEVGSEEAREGVMRSSGGSTSSLPPSSGWEWRYKEKWESEEDFSVVQGEMEPCAQITLEGKTNKSIGYSGTYTPVHGEWRGGHQVTFACPDCPTFLPITLRPLYPLLLQVYSSSPGFYLSVTDGGWWVGRSVGPGELEKCELVTGAYNPCPSLSIRSDRDWSAQCSSHTSN